MRLLAILFGLTSAHLEHAIVQRALQIIPSNVRQNLEDKYIGLDLLKAASSGSNEFSFQQQTKPFDCVLRTSACPQGRCLYRAVRHLYGSLSHAHHVDSSEVSKLATTDVAKASLLIGLVLDVSNPLNSGFSSDDSGKNVKVKGQTQVSLYDYYSEHLLTPLEISSLPLPDLQALYLEELSELRERAMSSKRKAVGELYHSGIETWLADSAAVACEIYKPGGGDLEISTKWKTIAMNQAKKSVVRVALVLYLLSIHQGGSSSAIPDGWHLNLLTNIVIAAIALPLYWMLARRLANISDNDFRTIFTKQNE